MSDEPKKRPAGPFADKFIEFQGALEAYGMASAGFGVAMERKAVDESIREVQHKAKVEVLRLYNVVLTQVQQAAEAQKAEAEAEIGRMFESIDSDEAPKSFSVVQCCHCNKHELGSAAHLDRDGEWVCDECWDERMA